MGPVIAQTLASSAAIFASGILLQVAGYVADQVQTAGALLAIRLLLGPIPAVLFLTAMLLLAWQDGAACGRVLCGVNAELNRAKQTSLGWFSLFESCRDPAVARALMGAAEAWLRAHGATVARGPMSPTQGDDYRGMLVEGFDQPPMLMDTYNPDWYPDLLAQCGYAKESDLWAFRYDAGRLPSGWRRSPPMLEFLLRRRRIRGVRIFILFVVPQWRKKAVTGAIFAHTMHAARRRGYTWGEGSTIGEGNIPMIREAEGAGGLHYKTFRVFRRELDQGVLA